MNVVIHPSLAVLLHYEGRCSMEQVGELLGVTGPTAAGYVAEDGLTLRHSERADEGTVAYAKRLFRDRGVSLPRACEMAGLVTLPI